MTLTLVPVDLRTANDFVAVWHRHLTRVVGHKWSTGVIDESAVLRGVAIVGRPVARHFDNGTTLEVTRLATDGTANACSMLYAAAWRAAKAMGYRRIVTMNLTEDESGASLRAAGYRIVAERPPRPGWNAPSRPREDRGADDMARTLWEATHV